VGNTAYVIVRYAGMPTPTEALGIRRQGDARDAAPGHAFVSYQTGTPEIPAGHHYTRPFVSKDTKKERLSCLNKYLLHRKPKIM